MKIELFGFFFAIVSVGIAAVLLAAIIGHVGKIERDLVPLLALVDIVLLIAAIGLMFVSGKGMGWL